MKCLIHARLYDFETYIEDGYLLFDEFIHSVGEMSDLPKGDFEIIDCKYRLVLPGLVSGHTHLYSAFARGLSVPFAPHNFQEILDQLWWKLDRNLDLDMVYHSGLAFAKEFLQNGVTTIIDHHASGAIKGSLSTLKKAIVEDARMRGIFAFETSDRFEVSECIEENNDFVQNNHNTKASGLIGLHAGLSLSDHTLKRISEETTAPLHVHVAESLLDQTNSLEEHGIRVVDRYDFYHLLRKDSLFVHCLYLTDNELDKIKAHDITIAVNVGSNMNNGVGLPNIPLFLDKKINVIIGNDGLSPSMTIEYLNCYFAMHDKLNSPLGFSLEDLRGLILNTYEYASRRLQTKLGKLKMGHVSDFLVIDYQETTPLTKGNIFSHLFFGLFHQFKPRDVYIEGKQEVKDFELTNPYLIKKSKDILESSQKAQKAVSEEDNNEITNNI